MSDIATVNLGPVIHAVHQVDSHLNVVHDAINRVNNKVDAVDNKLKATRDEVENLKHTIAQMQREQRFAAALQRALTEIIRVRQELESKFGTHKQVRDYMLGILQASDLGLIRTSTISKCTEELMISAPKYWLAPCLIALAAWISNDQALAERALAEGLKRDREKTCLLFALITNRVSVGRESRKNHSEHIDVSKLDNHTTFEWLAEYFKMQDPFRMRSSIVAYIDAYTNGVFGYDKDNLCGEHIEHWMDELKQKNPDFVAEQKKYWLNVFNGYCANEQTESKYKDLKRICVQFPEIEQYVVRIDAAERGDGIRQFIGNIMDAPVELSKLITDIDDQLIRLVSNYEEDEADLRDEEQLLSYIKQFKGDEERAINIMEAIKAKRQDEPVDFVQRLASSVFQNDATLSAKKTAIKLLRPYIVETFNEFITDRKDAYPKEIDLKIEEKGKVARGVKFTWSGKTENAENREQLVNGLSAQYETARQASKGKVTDEEANKTLKTGKILTFTFVFAILPIGPYMWHKGKKMLRENEATRKAIDKYYNHAKSESVQLLNNALDERVQANECIENFLSNDENEVMNF